LRNPVGESLRVLLISLVLVSLLPASPPAERGARDERGDAGGTDPADRVEDPVGEDDSPAGGVATTSVIHHISHETDLEKTRVILRGSAPIDYRGGRLMGDQVILDLANVEFAVGSQVVDLHAPEVVRVIVGPEITKEGERLIKVRLTGVKARIHKVMVRGNELHIDLMAVGGERERPRGFPKLIRNQSDMVT